MTQEQINSIRQGLGKYAAQARFVARRGKEPISPITGYGAKQNDPSTWGTLDQALAYVGKNEIDGIGVELGGGLCGIDLDHCTENKGSPEEWALDIMKIMRECNDGHGTYWESSPSKKGIHILFTGAIPDGARKKGNVEMYSEGRYFTLTGNGWDVVSEGTEQAAQVHKKYLEPKKPIRSVDQRNPLPNGKDYLQTGLEKDNKFHALWSGERQSNNESSNDIALMNKLAYWCNCDIDTMKSAFLSSPYAKQKDDAHWKKAAERQDYLQRTAVRAVHDCIKTATQSEEEYQAARLRQDFSVTIGSNAKTKFINPIETPQALHRYTLDDMGAARLFADTFRGQVLYLPEYKSYWTYQDGVWQQDKGDLMVRQLAKEMADYVREIIPPPPKPQKAEEPVPLEQTEKKKDPWAAHRKHYGKYRFLGSRKALIQDAQDELGGYASDFDRQTFLFNVKNGTLNLETMKMQEHNPADRLSKMANVVYEPNAKSERFERFIMEITEGKQERANMLQKALGYSLKGEANEECYFTAIGEKTRNGKGTLFDTILNIFGSYGAQMDFNTIARGGAKDGSRATPDLARLIGIRFALANEPEKGVCINEALLKQLTGGDDITARPLYGDLIEFKPVFKLFVTANSKPTVSDDSLFSSGRIKLLPFTRHFSEEEQDTNLKSGFRAEQAKSGILNWLLAGYKKYLAEGLRDTDEMKALTAEYRRENDYIGQYLDDRFNFAAKGSTTLKALRCDYASWCGVIGTKPLGLKGFKEELEKRSLEVKIIHKQFCIDGAINSGYDYLEENTS